MALRHPGHGPRFLVAVLVPLVASLSSCVLLPRSTPGLSPLTWSELEIESSPHRVGLVESGWRALALRVHLIREAQHAIDLQTFIWTEDEVGKLIAHELLLAARRGVRVRVLSDGLHTRLSDSLVAALASADPRLELRQYNPSQGQVSASMAELFVESLTRFSDMNQRAHDKVLVVDGRVALVGGRNIENTYFDRARGFNFRDREIVVEGELARRIRRVFEEFWEFELTVPSVHLSDVFAELQHSGPRRDLSAEALGVAELRAGLDSILASLDPLEDLTFGGTMEVGNVAYCHDYPGKLPPEGEPFSRNHVTSALAGLIRNAEDSVVVQTPYLVLSDRAMQILRDLREEHPDLELVASTNSLASIDFPPALAVTYRQTRFLIEELEVGLYEFKPRPGDLDLYLESRAELPRAWGESPTLCLHSKSVVIDGLISGVGSHNFGPRSSGLNTEVMVFVWDRAFAERLRQSVEHDTHPRNSWVVWKRERPPVLGEGLALLEGVSSVLGAVTSIDPWPSTYTSCFELREGMEPVPPTHPEFHERYRAVGQFPGVSPLQARHWLTRLMKAVGGFADPLL